MTLLAGKRGLIVGLANQRSLAFGIAQAATQAGAKLVLTYQNQRFQPGVEQLVQELSQAGSCVCDVTQPQTLQTTYNYVQQTLGGLDFLVHAVAFAQRSDLEGRFVDTSLEGFQTAMHISAYSLLSLTQTFEPMLRRNPGQETSSILTLSYLAAQRAMPHYNVMGVAKAALESSVRFLARELGASGIRVNALSPGPVKTLSAAGIQGLRNMLQFTEQEAPLKRNIDLRDVGRAAVFMLSDLSSGVTGDVLFVDNGMHALAHVPPTLHEQT